MKGSISKRYDARRDRDLISFRKQLAVAKKHLKKAYKRKASAPLYLLIGPKSSGKSHLILNSELDFTDNPDITGLPWRFTENEVLIELEQYTSANTWSHCLTLLESLSPKHPINGIVIVMDTRDWEKAGIDEQLIYLNNVLGGLDEKNSIPLYLTFTKCDLLSGFHEFYEDFTAEQKQACFGIQLSSAPSGLAVEFNHEFLHLSDRLNSNVIMRLHQERDSKIAALIKHFPLQFEQFGKYVERFIDVFVKNETRHLKGVYFTSNVQHGAAIDFLSPSYSKETHLPIHPPQQKPKLIPSPYFIKGVFNTVIHARNTVIIRKHSVNKWAPILSSVFLVAFSGLFYNNYLHNMHALEKTQLVLNKLNAIDENDTFGKLSTLSQLKNSLSKADSARYFFIGQSEIEKLNTKVTGQYLKLIETAFQKELVDALETKLAAADSENISELYSALHIYSLLGKNTLSGNDYIKHWFQKYWSNDASLTSKKASMLKDHLNVYLNHHKPIKENPALVAKAEQSLNAVPMPELLFAILSSRDINPPLTFAETSKPVPALYTRNQFESIYNDKIVAIANSLKHTNNLTNEQTSTLITEARALYITNYDKAWKDTLASYKIPTSSSIGEQAQNIRKLVAHDSPLMVLLEKIKENTAKLEGTPAFNEKVSRDFYSMNQITTHWRSELVKPALNKLLNYLSTISADENQSRAAFDVAKIWMQNDGRNDPIENLQQIATQLPEPMSQWVSNIADTSWKLILADAKNFINQHWQREFYAAYEKSIANHYPFKQTAEKEVSLSDFTEFFKPDGTLKNFYSRYLQAFVDTHDIYWTWKQVHGETLPASQQTLETFIRGSLIQKMFFARTMTVPFTSFSLVPINYSKDLHSFRFALGSQSADFSPGNTFVSNFSWPPQGNYLARVDFLDDKNQTKEMTASGPWALFKLLAQGTLKETNDPKRYKLTLGVDTDHSTEYELLASTNINPFMPNVINRFLPPETL